MKIGVKTNPLTIEQLSQLSGQSTASIRREIKNGVYRTIPNPDGTKGVFIDMEDLAQQATQQAEEALRQARGTSLLRKEQK
ncbi:hypothetical protein LU674_029450 [Pseudomonas alloputida]|uniref:DNA-binding protein n=1 Tax=Pseudomonas alloputida TaxID=1940621 RepID=A0AAW7HPZ6_9PSED|nr:MULTISPECIES: hypothetical protein [Pseudomonas putida group]MBA6105538.1 hypothetical protein [Pseudomonas monteilii]MCE0861316.1 hypothetical protein [Pseudomonas alloputida]MCE0869930.1 hypothetical protein [Pseudomonas alloputida]MCE1150128.1 hypothetical protein [Pseudomonas alloputida]MDM3956401.1 hypothetical protein [Pseudomonas alloputida]